MRQAGVIGETMPELIQAASAGTMLAFVDALTIMIAKSADDPDDMAQMFADIIVTDVALRTAKGVA